MSSEHQTTTSAAKAKASGVVRGNGNHLDKASKVGLIVGDHNVVENSTIGKIIGSNNVVRNCVIETVEGSDLHLDGVRMG